MRDGPRVNPDLMRIVFCPTVSRVLNARHLGTRWRGGVEEESRVPDQPIDLPAIGIAGDQRSGRPDRLAEPAAAAPGLRGGDGADGGGPSPLRPPGALAVRGDPKLLHARRS